MNKYNAFPEHLDLVLCFKINRAPETEAVNGLGHGITTG